MLSQGNMSEFVSSKHLPVSRCGVRCSGCWMCLAPPLWLRRRRTCVNRCCLFVQNMLYSIFKMLYTVV